MDIDLTPIRLRWEALSPILSEREKRLFAAAEANAAGFGGVAAVSLATGVARSTIRRGLDDLAAGLPATVGEVRRPGGGRKPITETQPTILDNLRAVLEPATMGDPMRPLLWVSKSYAKLADALRAMGHDVSEGPIPGLVQKLGFSRQSNRKTLDGGNHPDRDAQFEHINATALEFMANGEPVISVDTKKKGVPQRHGRSSS